MIPPERLHEIAESRRISPSWGEVESMAAELLAARETRARHITDMAAVAQRHLDAVAQRDEASELLRATEMGYEEVTKERDAARAELSALHARIEQSHNGYQETGKALGMDRPASHLIALGELLTEQVELADSVVRIERDEARAEAKKYHDALVARHGGEPVALLSELDAARAEAENIRAELAAAQANLAKVLAAGETVADALRDIAGDGHRAYLDEWESAIAAAEQGGA